MPAQRTSMSACHVSGQQSDSSLLPSFTRQLALVSTRLSPTLDGRPATSADSGPNTTCTRTHTASSTAALCAQLDSLRAALSDAGDVDGQVLDILTATMAGLSAAVLNTIGQTPATITIGPRPDFWRQMRLSRDWTQKQVINRLEQAAASIGVSLPARESLQVMVSEWERGKRKLSDRDRRLFRIVYDLPEEQTVTVHTQAVA